MLLCSKSHSVEQQFCHLDSAWWRTPTRRDKTRHSHLKEELLGHLVILLFCQLCCRLVPTSDSNTTDLFTTDTRTVNLRFSRMFHQSSNPDTTRDFSSWQTNRPDRGTVLMKPTSAKTWLRKGISNNIYDVDMRFLSRCKALFSTAALRGGNCLNASLTSEAADLYVHHNLHPSAERLLSEVNSERSVPGHTQNDTLHLFPSPGGNCGKKSAKCTERKVNLLRQFAETDPAGPPTCRWLWLASNHKRLGDACRWTPRLSFEVSVPVPLLPPLSTHTPHAPSQTGPSKHNH